jgi:hypothetical protein
MSTVIAEQTLMNIGGGMIVSKTMFAGSVVLVMGGIMLWAKLPVVHALCTSMLRDGSFEMQRSRTLRGPWIGEGAAGVDIALDFAREGRNNAYARNVRGWNGLRQSVTLAAGARYNVSAFVRTSANLRDGYFGFRDAAQRPVAELKFGARPRYSEVQVTFVARASGVHYIFIGFWAPNQDAWIQVDSFQLYGPCSDVILNPVHE